MSKRLNFDSSLVFLFIFSFGYGQFVDNILGTWTEVISDGARCPALALFSDNRPTLFALTPIGTSTTDFTLYALQQKMQDPSTGEWGNDYPVYNLNPREVVSDLSLSLDETGQAFISWVESKHQYNEPSIVLGQKGGASEAYQVFSNDPSKDAFAISSAFDMQNNPVVAWSEGFSTIDSSSGQVVIDYLQQAYYTQRKKSYSNTIIYIQRWNGDSWQDISVSLDGHNPTLVLNKEDVLYLSYIRTTAQQSEALVVYWDGQNWQQLGEAVSRNLFDFVPPRVLYVKEWNGESWQFLGTSELAFDAACPTVKLDDQGNPMVAYSQIGGDGRRDLFTAVKVSRFFREQ